MPEKKENVTTGGHRPVCCKCNCEMRPERNGVGVLDHDDNDSPRQVWEADKWKCPECGVEIVIGFGWHPVSDDFEDDFEYHVKYYQDAGLLIKNTKRG